MRRKKIASVVLVSAGIGGLSVVLGAGGCTLVVGSYQVVLEDGSTDSTIGVDTGSGDSSSTVSDSGADTTSPLQDSPITTEDAGDGATPTCGSTIPTTSPTFQQLLLSCVLDQGCNYSPTAYPENAVTSVGLCVTYNLLSAGSGLSACEAKATNCAYIETCTGQSYIGCDAGAPGWSCQGNLSTYCYPPGSGTYTGWGDYFDCAEAKGTCTTYVDTQNIEAGVQGGCEVLPSCTVPDDGTYYCSQNFEYTCIDKAGGGTVGIGNSCQEYNGTCDNEAGTGAACDFTLTGCSSTTPVCAGAVGQQCYTNGLESYDCSIAGGECQPAADTFTGLNFTCVSPGCDPTTCQESCSGTVATFCVGGAPVTFDCASVSMVCIDSGTADENGNNYMQCHPF